MIEITPHNALEIGKAAEHIVCAKIILEGYRAFLSDQGLPYDVVMDFEGALLRIQVRATGKPKNVAAFGRAVDVRYSFSVRRRGRDGSKRLQDEECDLVALVAIDTMEVAFLPVFECGQSIQLRASSAERKPGNWIRKRDDRINEFPLHQALSRMAAGKAEIQANGTLYSEATLFEFRGVRKSLSAHANDHGKSLALVGHRLRRGWTIENALTIDPSVKWARQKGKRLG